MSGVLDNTGTGIYKISANLKSRVQAAFSPQQPHGTENLEGHRSQTIAVLQERVLALELETKDQQATIDALRLVLATTMKTAVLNPTQREVVKQILSTNSSERSPSRPPKPVARERSPSPFPRSASPAPASPSKRNNGIIGGNNNNDEFTTVSNKNQRRREMKKLKVAEEAAALERDRVQRPRQVQTDANKPSYADIAKGAATARPAQRSPQQTAKFDIMKRDMTLLVEKGNVNNTQNKLAKFVEEEKRLLALYEIKQRPDEPAEEFEARKRCTEMSFKAEREVKLRQLRRDYGIAIDKTQPVKPFHIKLARARPADVRHQVLCYTGLPGCVRNVAYLPGGIEILVSANVASALEGWSLVEAGHPTSIPQRRHLTSNDPKIRKTAAEWVRAVGVAALRDSIKHDSLVREYYTDAFLLVTGVALPETVEAVVQMATDVAAGKFERPSDKKLYQARRQSVFATEARAAKRFHDDAESEGEDLSGSQMEENTNDNTTGAGPTILF